MPDPSAQPASPSTPGADASIDDRAEMPAEGKTSGPRPPEPRRRENPPKGFIWLALIGSAIGVIAMSLLIGLLLMALLVDGPDAEGRGFEAVFIAFQVSVVSLTVFAASRFGPLSQTLALGGSIAPRRHVWLLLAAMVCAWLIGLYISLAFFRDLLLQDIATYQEAFRSPDLATRAATLFATVVGAPVSEELLFRGFLLGGLLTAGCPMVAAVLVSNTIWTLLHAGYSVLGLIDVFIAGLFLSALFVLTRSVWWPVVVHAVFNTAAIGVMYAVTG